MGTALEHLGANLNNSLWTARVLLDQPELVKKVHLDYFHAGADAGITCSYQATIPGLMANGLSEKKPRISLSVQSRSSRKPVTSGGKKKARPRTAPIPCV